MKKNNKAGILVYRYNHILDDYEYMIVRKLFTHEFMKIITGKYNSIDNHIIFNKLTTVEEFILNNYDMEEIYCTFFKINKNIPNKYIKIMHKISAKYNNYIKKKTNSMLKIKQGVNWEIPKGHIEYNETSIDCAFRELYEETKICKDDLINSYISPMYENITYNKNTCRTLYFIYKYKNDIISSADNNNSVNESKDEIVCRKWVTLSELEFTEMNRTSKNIIYKIHKQLIRIHNL